MSEYKFYSIHNIVKIKTNTEIPIPNYFEIGRKIDNPDIEIIQENFSVNVPREKKKQRKDYFVWVDETALYIDYEVLNMKLFISDIQGRTRIKFTETYRNHGKKHISNLIHIVLAIKLIQKGYAPIHAGCVSCGDKAILISGMGSTGKTSTVLSLLDAEYYKFMADDMTIVSRDGKAYSYPEKVGVSFQTLTGNMFSPSIKTKIFGKLTESHLISLFFGKFFNLWRMEQKEIPDEMIKDKAFIEKVFLITCGEKDEIKQIEINKAVRMLMMSMMDEHSLFGNYALNFYSYLFGLDLLEFACKAKEIIKNALNKAKCFELKSNKTWKYPEMVKKAIEVD